MTFSMGQTVLFAVAGPVFRDIGLSEIQLGIVVSAAAVVFVLASPIWGRLSDRWGRKRVIVFGLFTYTATSAAFALCLDIGLRGLTEATTVFVLALTIRLTYAALGAGIQPASVALMADLSTDEERSSAVAIVGAAFGLGMILGPASAAVLVIFGVLTPLYAIAILGLGCALLAFVALPDERATASAAVAPGSQLSVKRLVPLLAAGLLFFIAVSALQQTMAFYVQDYAGVDSAEAARLTGYCFVVMALFSLVVQGGIVQWLKPNPGLMLRGGMPLMLIGVTLYAFPQGYWQLLLAGAFFGLGFGFINPGLIAAASLRSGSEHQGAAAGLMQATMAGGYVVGPLAGTAVYGTGGLGTASLIGAAVAVALLVVLALRFDPPANVEVSSGQAS